MYLKTIIVLLVYSFGLEFLPINGQTVIHIFYRYGAFIQMY